MFMQQLTWDPYDHKGLTRRVGGFLFCDIDLISVDFSCFIGIDFS